MKGRVVSAAIATTSLFYVLGGRSFDADFVADPIGPKAFPIGIGAILLLATLVLAVEGRDGSLLAVEGRDGSPRLRLRQLAVVGLLAVYVSVLRPLGFLLATPLLVAGVVALFDGPWRRGVVLGAVACGAIFALFTYGLSVPLPVGLIFGGR